jgi:hypothetical protein
MKRFARIAARIAAAGSILCAHAAAPQEAAPQPGGPRRPPPPEVELPAEGTSVPMGSFGGRPTVEARIGGAAFPFVLDTGASGCALSDAFADAQKIPVVGRAGFASPDSPERKEARLLRIDALELGGARITGVTAVGMDLSGPFPGPQDPRGVLSANVFPGLLVTIDYPGGTASLARGELPPPDGESVFGYAEGRRVPGLSVSLGDQSVELDVDTGSPYGITLPAEWSSKLKLDAPPREARPDRRVDRVLPAKEGRYSGPVRIGRYDLGPQPIRFVEGTSRGVVGSDVLRRFAITLDSKNRRVRLTQPG